MKARRHRLSPFVALAVLLAVALATQADAGNLVPNSEFDRDTAGWDEVSDGQSLLGWASLDHDTCGAGSGSALAANGATTPDNGMGFHTCVTGVVGGQSYSLGGDLRFPTGQTATGTANLTVFWYGSSDCSVHFLGVEPAQPELSTDTSGVWVSALSESAIAPASAHSAELRVTVIKEQANDVLLLRFDGVYLAPGGGFLFGDGLDTGSFCRWSALSVAP